MGMWAAALWFLAVIAALGVGADKALGVAIGGGITLGFFRLHLALARQWLAPTRRRSARIYLWFVWLLKWPISGTLLYLALTSGWADPIWLCLGAGVVPLAVTAVALTLLPSSQAGGPVAQGVK